MREGSLVAPGWDVSLADDVAAAPARLPPPLLSARFGRIDRGARLALPGRALGRLESRYWFRSRGGAVVARVVTPLVLL